MARSPKVTKTTTKEVKPLKPILKDTTSTTPSTSMAIVSKPIRESPPGGGPKRPPGGEPKQRKQALPPGGEPKQRKQPPPPGGGDDIDESIYYNLFEETVQKELPKVDDEYSVEYLQDDIVCIIADIFETYNYLVIPDQEMLQKIATNKITDSKLKNEFIFGKEGGMHNSKLSCHEKIKEYSKFIRKSTWDNIIDKYSQMEV
jgi:hypothetical protein